MCDHAHATKVADVMREPITGACNEHEVAGDAEACRHLEGKKKAYVQCMHEYKRSSVFFFHLCVHVCMYVRAHVLCYTHIHTE